jgi:hypothetical protein
MSKTVTVYATIGNSDDKLTQKQWSSFCQQLHDAFFISYGGVNIHGMWFSSPASEYQNACVCAEVRTDSLDDLRTRLKKLALGFGQDSIAFVVGNTEFLKGE